MYDGLEALLGIQALKERHSRGFSYTSAGEAYNAYTGELFRFDQYYRQFCMAADDVEARSDLFKQVSQTVEGWISGWYMTALTCAWDAVLGGDNGLLTSWRIPDVPAQTDFFVRFVNPLFNSPNKPRVFVIISDGLRYEIAEELTRNLNTNSRFKAELRSQLSVLPGITSLGMAALLPHHQLTVKPGNRNPCGRQTGGNAGAARRNSGAVPGYGDQSGNPACAEQERGAGCPRGRADHLYLSQSD